MGTNSFVQQRNRRQRRVMMIAKVRDFFRRERAGCDPVDNGKSTKATQCPSCKDRSLVQYYTKGKAEVIRVCFHRYDPITEERCDYTDKVDASTILPAWAKSVDTNAAASAV